MGAHVAKTLQAKPELVPISTTYGIQKEGSAVLPRKATILLAAKAKANGHFPHGARVRRLNDKKKPDHWQAV